MLILVTSEVIRVVIVRTCKELKRENEAIPNTPLERSEVIRAVIVRICKELKRDNGMIIQYDGRHILGAQTI
ncbi:hypothetical protein G4B88_001743 [Cannabis sativa]|uniref:Uncharacterized protein n=1 Tax=Cannabis sativa TaxID=3483 RepID=A0A7J6I372_CANSA|nr:hypothetical protein G4B88_001743 [Cannabis sativa]